MEGVKVIKMRTGEGRCFYGGEVRKGSGGR